MEPVDYLNLHMNFKHFCFIRVGEFTVRYPSLVWSIEVISFSSPFAILDVAFLGGGCLQLSVNVTYPNKCL